ncbi:hypothetical protein [Profundibacter sp.]
MPFLRLVIIYIVVILGAVLVFKRDSVMSLLGGADAEISVETDAPAKSVEPVALPTATPVATSKVEATSDAGTEPPAAGQPSKYPTQETARTATPMPAPAPTTAPVKDIQSRLTDARQAYWNRDLKGAEAQYKSLVADAPTNADIKGELGNLYYGMRRMVDAARMYHQAGLQLIADGNRHQIMPLIGVLQSIAPDKAGDLRNRLSQ